MSSMLCAKPEYNRNAIVYKCLEFYDLKNNERYIFYEL